MANVRSERYWAGLAPRPKSPRGPDPEEWSALLAHDLKTPFAAISMNLDYVLSVLPVGTSDSVHEALSDCKVANARAVRLVQDMVDGLRLATGDLKPSLADVAISHVVERVVAAMGTDANSYGVRILWASGSDVVRADAGLIERALGRLLERAIRHAGGRCVVVDQRAGTITIRVETPIDSDIDSSERALATHFAETAVRAQGGYFAVESSAGLLAYRVKLPTCE